MYIFLILSILLCVISFCIYNKTKQIKIDNNSKLEEFNRITILIEEAEKSLEIIKKNKQEQEELILEIQEEQNARIEEVFRNKKEQMRYALEQYGDVLEKEYNNYENNYYNNISLINKEIDSAKIELNKLKNLLSEGAKANLREKELEEKEYFYTIQLDEKSIKEVKAIKDIEYILSDPRPLRMLVWTNYYSKKANDMCNRILGTNKKIGIYKITNLKTKEVYIGQSKDIKERWREHLKCGLGIDTPAGNKLYNAMMKYGLESFSFELLSECSSEELNEKEKSFIDLYDSYNFGMNSNRGIGK